MRVRAKATVHDHLVDEFDHQHLTPHEEYMVVGIDHESFRVINDADEPILYPKALFEVVSAHVPADWIRREFGDGEYYWDPPECSLPGFYEDWFDADATAREVFQAVRERLLREA